MKTGLQVWRLSLRSWTTEMTWEEGLTVQFNSNGQYSSTTGTGLSLTEVTAGRSLSDGSSPSVERETSGKGKE